MRKAFPEDPELVVILLCWNDAEEIGTAITGLQDQLPERSTIIVVDNGSSDPFSTDNDAIRVIHSPENLGYSGGNNLGIRAALKLKPEFILLLNTDARFELDGLTKLLNDLRLRPDVDLTAPVISEDGILYFGGGDPGLYLNTRIREKPVTMPENYYLPGTVLLFRADLIPEIGYLDQRYFFSGEIADFCVRASVADRKIWLNENVTITHDLHQQDTGLRKTLYVYYNLRNRFLFVRKHHADRIISLFIRWVTVCLRQLAGSVLRLDLPKARAVFWAMIDGLFANFGNRNDRFI